MTSATPKSLRSKKALVFGLAVVVPAGLFLIGYVQFWSPYQKLNDSDWFESSTAEEQRRVAHQVLSWPVGNDAHHDAFLVLGEHGNLDSVPYIITALKRRAFFYESDLLSDTDSHGFMALNRITCHDHLRELNIMSCGSSWMRNTKVPR